MKNLPDYIDEGNLLARVKSIILDIIKPILYIAILIIKVTRFYEDIHPLIAKIIKRKNNIKE